LIVIVVFIELIAAALAVWGIANSSAGGRIFYLAPWQLWATCAILQLAIHYRPPRPGPRNAIASLVGLMLLGSLILEGGPLPYFNQVLFIASVAVLPQLWLEWSSLASTGGRALWLLFVGLMALPVGYTAWSLANIAIVQFKAERVARGEQYCLLVPKDNFQYFKDPASVGNYRIASGWQLSGSVMFADRNLSVDSLGGDCCQWEFHGLLLTHSNKLFNWSYQSQRFDMLSDESRRKLDLGGVSCKNA